MNAAELWDTWINAEIYREYVDRFPLYPALNRRLVELAQVSRARRVLDLGCGTGATTSACLEKLPARGEVEGIDTAGTMLEAARGHVRDPRARFRQANAGSVDETVPGSFDRVLCNASFWLFPKPTYVLNAVGRVLRPGGLFTFNVPLELIAGEHVEPGPFQFSLAQAVVERTGFRPLPPPVVDRQALQQNLWRTGFRCRAMSRFDYHGRQGELMELMKVPALAIQLAPELGYEACLDIVKKAATRNDPRLEVEIPWAFFVAMRYQN